MSLGFSVQTAGNTTLEEPVQAALAAWLGLDAEVSRVRCRRGSCSAEAVRAGKRGGSLLCFARRQFCRMPSKHAFIYTQPTLHN